MARTTEIPGLVAEFFDLAKRYLRQETIEPAKRLGRLAGFSFGAALVLVLAVVFLSIAGARVLIDILPDGPMWSGLGYLIASIALLGLTGLMMWRVTR